MTSASTSLSTTYLVKNDNTSKKVIKAEEHFSITDHSTTIDTLLYGTECKILVEK